MGLVCSRNSKEASMTRSKRWCWGENGSSRILVGPHTSLQIKYFSSRRPGEKLHFTANISKERQGFVTCRILWLLILCNQQSPSGFTKKIPSHLGLRKKNHQPLFLYNLAFKLVYAKEGYIKTSKLKLHFPHNLWSFSDVPPPISLPRPHFTGQSGTMVFQVPTVSHAFLYHGTYATLSLTLVSFHYR